MGTLGRRQIQLAVRRRWALKSVQLVKRGFGKSRAVRLLMSRNFSPNLIVIKILEKINILILLYKTLIESFGYCVRD